jgi:uncharacterized membrane protein
LQRFDQKLWFHSCLLGVWIALGALLRFWNLDSKPLWTDEFATLVFSLGHTFRTVPLNQALTSEQLLEPLQVKTIGSVTAVIERLLTESNHPPLYFVLCHGWLRLFSASDGLVSVWLVRSLSAILGILCIPAMFGLGWLSFESLFVGQVAAALMAVSPFGVYLAQEARHYTLPLLWIVGSLACLVTTLRYLTRQIPLPRWLALLWVSCNSLGMATHYFFALTLLAEGLVLFLFWGRWVWQNKKVKNSLPASRWFVAVALGTLLSGLIWLPYLRNGYDSELTRWAFEAKPSAGTSLEPITNLLAGMITMVTLLPVQKVPSKAQLSSAAIMVIFILWLGGFIGQRLLAQKRSPRYHLPLLTLTSFVITAIATLLLLEYALGANITNGLRYGFIYFPAVIVLVAAGLVLPTQSTEVVSKLSFVRIGAILGVLLMGILSSLLVVFNQGYQKVHRPDIVAQDIQTRSQYPALVVISHQTHGQTGRLMGVAWELRKAGQPVQFYLDHQACSNRDRCLEPSPELLRAIAQLPRPFDLWLINYHKLSVVYSPLSAERVNSLTPPQCTAINLRSQRKQLKPRNIDGYQYQLYRCPTL